MKLLEIYWNSPTTLKLTIIELVNQLNELENEIIKLSYLFGVLSGP